jgi:hypothetical protein
MCFGNSGGFIAVMRSCETPNLESKDWAAQYAECQLSHTPPQYQLSSMTGQRQCAIGVLPIYFLPGSPQSELTWLVLKITDVEGTITNVGFLENKTHIFSHDRTASIYLPLERPYSGDVRFGGVFFLSFGGMN